jgi:hypothetical protein
MSPQSCLGNPIMAAPVWLCQEYVSYPDAVGAGLLVAGFAAWRTADLFLSRDIHYTLWQRRWLLRLGIVLAFAGAVMIVLPRVQR